mmetsp:Transcript_11710/g.29593  ORF Transcript_11710/g.29593 Transcript_11710/m.29593 type:complete len:212 (+) Transcript_11710:1840-2475(+)
MGRLIGNAAEVHQARTALSRAIRLLSISAPEPELAAIFLQRTIRHRRRLRRLMRPVSRAWPSHLNRLNIDLAVERVDEALFQDTYRCRPEVFDQLLEHLKIPDVLRCESRQGKFTGTTGLLVLLARLGTAGAAHSLGAKLRMNPKRISKICTHMVKWLTQRWGHVVMTGALDSRLPGYVRAIQRKSGVMLPVFGFIDLQVLSKVGVATAEF